MKYLLKQAHLGGIIFGDSRPKSGNGNRQQMYRQMYNFYKC